MSKVVIFGHMPPNFFDDLFLDTPQKFFGLPKFFNLFGLKNHFLDFIDLKTVFYPKKTSFLDLKIFSRPKNFY